MTEQQLTEIEQRWAKANCDDLDCAINDVYILLAEVRRLKQVVDRAVDYFCKMPCGDCPCNEMCSVIGVVPLGQTCEQTICKYLESEVADK